MKSNDVTLKSLLKPSTDPDRIPSACDVLNMTEWQPTNQMKKFCLQGINRYYINKRDTSSLNCKHKHMLLKTELHLTNLVPCTICYTYNSMVLSAEAMFHGYHTYFFVETIWVPLKIT